MTLRSASLGAPAARSSRSTIPWRSGLNPSPPWPSGNDTQARPASKRAPRNSTTGVDAGSWAARSSRILARTRSSSVRTASVTDMGATLTIAAALRPATAGSKAPAGAGGAPSTAPRVPSAPSRACSGGSRCSAQRAHDPGLSLHLRPVHGLIGGTDDVGDARGAVGPTRRHADGNRQGALAEGRHEGPGESLEDALGQIHGLVLVGEVLADHEELVPSESADGVGLTHALG